MGCSREPALLWAKGWVCSQLAPFIYFNWELKQPVDLPFSQSLCTQTSGSKQVMQRFKTQRLPNTQPCPPHPGRARKEGEESPGRAENSSQGEGELGLGSGPLGARSCGTGLEASPRSLTTAPD